eukprot:jgi/Botrbrau1/21138/Bobra.0061s0032.1
MFRKPLRRNFMWLLCWWHRHCVQTSCSINADAKHSCLPQHSWPGKHQLHRRQCQYSRGRSSGDAFPFTIYQPSVC